METRAIHRILDASANRAAEGLRTIEAFTRFSRDHADSTDGVKRLRHDLTEAMQHVERMSLLAARDTAGDCGTELSTPAEQQRAGMLAVAQAAFARVQQSLRSIEEYGKIVSPQLGVAAEALRYRTYDLEKDILLPAHRRQQLFAARLYVLVDLQADLDEWTGRIVALANAGVHVIQIRDKTAADRELFAYSKKATEALRAVPESLRSLLIVNDRPDIAVAANADGVHVGQDELPAEIARKIVGEDKLVGVSTHSVPQAEEAVAAGADYIGCGPTFPSQTKSFSEFAGLELLRQVASSCSIPAFAIGGIALDNVSSVRQAGFHRVAVGAAVWGQPDEVAAARRLIDGLPVRTQD